MHRRHLAMFALCAAMLYAACSPTPPPPASGTSTLAAPGPTRPSPTQARTPSDVPPMPEYLQKVHSHLAQSLGLGPEQVVLREVEAVEWPDSCLGAARPGEMCAQVVTPGYRAVFTTPGGEFEFHTDESGQRFRLASAPSAPMPDQTFTLAIWERSGGIAGICQRLTIRSDGAYLLEDCATRQTVSEGTLARPSLDRLLQWADLYVSHAWAFTPPPGSADMFLDRYDFNGLGRRHPTQSEQEAMNEYLAALAADLAAPARATTNGAAEGSGIEGAVFVGPACPVARAEDPCPDKPYQAAITVLDARGREVVSFQTDPGGRFRVGLAPGTYVLRPESPGPLPRAGEQTVVVTSGEYTSVTISYDSGIR